MGILHCVKLDRHGLSVARCIAERTAEVHGMREGLERAQQAHSSLERDLAGALAMQQQEAQSMAKVRDSALARALAAETQAADLKEANDKLFQQQQVPAPHRNRRVALHLCHAKCCGDNSWGA